jgi:hypothetical protein
MNWHMVHDEGRWLVWREGGVGNRLTVDVRTLCRHPWRTLRYVRTGRWVKGARGWWLPKGVRGWWQARRSRAWERKALRQGYAHVHASGVAPKDTSDDRRYTPPAMQSPEQALAFRMAMTGQPPSTRYLAKVYGKGLHDE